MLFGSTILEVAIGMVFIYLLLSLVCSAANEVIATNTKRRSWMLEQGIRNLLLDSRLDSMLSAVDLKNKRVELKAHAPHDAQPGADKQDSTQAATSTSRTTLGDIFYDHPLIKSLYQPRWFRFNPKKPAYIPARTFALTLLDIIAPEKKGRSRTFEDVRDAIEGLPKDSDVRRALMALLDEAEGDIERFRGNVEDWFNVGMDRVSDWYRRRTHRIIFVIGMVIAAMLNADSIMIYKVLYSEPAVRAAVLAQSDTYVKKQAAQPSPTPAPAPTAASASAPNPSATPVNGQTGNNDAAVQKEIDEAKQTLEDRIREYKQLENLGLPIGWSNKGTQVSRMPVVSLRRQPSRFIWEWLLKIVGLVITGFALSLGAPFWFDLLNRFISFRTALKPPESTPEKRERSMSLTTPPRPPGAPGSSAQSLEGAKTKPQDDAPDTKSS
jgi:hypothetical protein